MKYAIIQTWNGEGYSYENIAEIKEFKNDSEAKKYLHELFAEQINANVLKETKTSIHFEIGDDQGSFSHISNAEKLLGVMIETNINEVYTIRNKKDWRDKLSYAIGQADPEEVDELNLADDRIFISAYESDYDYQFIRF